MRTVLASRTWAASASLDPVYFTSVPLQVNGRPTRITAIGIACNFQVDTGAGGGIAVRTNVGIMSVTSLVVLAAGSAQNNREIFRMGAGYRLQDWHALVMGRLPAVDPAATSANGSNDVRRWTHVIPCRGNPKLWRRPKDLDIPTWALHNGGNLQITCGAVADVTNLTAVDSGTYTVYAEYEADDDAELPVPWRVGQIDTSANTVELPPEQIAYLAMQNADRDHSDNTTVHLPGYVDNTGFQVLASEFSRRVSDDVTAGSGALTLATPEILPIIYPETGSKTLDIPLALPPIQLTRTSTDAQRFHYLALGDVRKHVAGFAAAFGVDAQKVQALDGFRRKFASKNPASADKFQGAKLDAAQRVLPIKMTADAIRAARR